MDLANHTKKRYQDSVSKQLKIECSGGSRIPIRVQAMIMLGVRVRKVCKLV